MLISTRGRYALRVMADLAKSTDGEYVPMKDVACRQEISLKYLERILPSLTKAGLIEGVHGKGGGYKLARKPSEYTLLEILTITESELAPVACLCKNSEPCMRSANCKTLPIWEGFYTLTKDYFNNILLSDII